MRQFIILIVLLSSTIPFVYSSVTDDCTITKFSQVNTVLSSCKNIIISNLLVPGGEQLLLNLQNGSTLTFEGVTKFEVFHWEGPLVKVVGDNVTVEGAPGSILNAQGEKYWDGQGGAGGVTKPRFFYIQTTGGSVFRNIYLLNCPLFCLIIAAQDISVTGWVLDSVAGDKDLIALNTDGIGISTNSNNVLVENCTVLNQDDCIVVNAGNNIRFRNVHCYGSHGLSFAVGFGSQKYNNSVANVTFEDSFLANGLYGIHFKVSPNGNEGHLQNIVFRNIRLSGIQEDGIYIQQDYGDIGNLGSNMKIHNLTIENVYGSVQGELTRPIHIFCGNHSTCYDWKFSGINIIGGGPSYCNYEPEGFSCN
ncbi:polygalacturonase-like isoform X1 [Diorhabda carinulata]|uniref:polygalacturonase-like isoform X1 n=1 Tax=Diorhabda carinulata TaxID=1163345 RepID=UPI0025A10E96|nr:polygalacturonase-like isoform X1 [Diorhabda carinulata]